MKNRNTFKTCFVMLFLTWNFQRPPMESLTRGKMLGQLGTGKGDKQNCTFPKGTTPGFVSRSCRPLAVQFASFLEHDVLELPAYF